MTPNAYAEPDLRTLHSPDSFAYIARLISFLLLLPVLLSACQRTPDETVIRQHLVAMSKAIETRDSNELLAHVADTYTDHDGRDKRGLRQMALGYFLQQGGIAVSVSDIAVDVRNHGAEVTLRAQFSGNAALGNTFNNTAYSVRLWWKKQGSDWQLYRANWERQENN